MQTIEGILKFVMDTYCIFYFYLITTKYDR